jgi:ribonuclease J
MSFRPSMATELSRAGCLDGAGAIWMMWAGYLEGEAGNRTRAIFDRLGIDLKVIHVSGHASVEDLQRLAAAINADKVIPIHTDVPELFDSLFDRVEIHGDGEWWEV